jgi:hypothetical protein
VVDAIVRLCSFEHMSGLEVTQSGKTDLVIGTVQNSSFFRRGVVGDWVNHLSPETARRIDAITAAKFKGSGLSPTLPPSPSFPPPHVPCTAAQNSLPPLFRR